MTEEATPPLTPEQYQQAYETLYRLHRGLLEQLVQETLELEEGMLGSFAFTELENRYVHRMGHLASMLRTIKPYTQVSRPKVVRKEAGLQVHEVAAPPGGVGEALRAWIAAHGGRRELIQVIPEPGADGVTTLIIISREVE